MADMKTMDDLNDEGKEFVGSYFDQYDDVAVEVVGDTTPNTASGMQMSCADMCERVCQVMGWEDFDLLAEHKFEEVYNTGSPPRILAYGMIAFLRQQVFKRAEERGIGLSGVNETITVHSNKWSTMLFEKWNALREGREVVHKWNN